MIVLVEYSETMPILVPAAVQSSTATPPEPQTTAPPGWWQTFFAPFTCLTRPERAAQRFADGPRSAFWSAFVFVGLLLGLLVVPLDIYAQYARVFAADEPPQTFSFLEAWKACHAPERGNPAECLFLLVLIGWTLLVAAFAWLSLPWIHGGPSVWTSYRRSFCAMASGGGLLTILSACLGTAYVWVLVARVNDGTVAPRILPLLVPTTFAAAAAMVAWLSAATRGVSRSAISSYELPPRCEGCGYDMTHRPASGLCSECGLPLEQSLQPGLRRPGSPWQQKPNFVGWARTTFLVIASPTEFFGRLKLRAPIDQAWTFSRRQFLAIGIGAWLWLFIFLASTSKKGTIILAFPAAFAFVAPLAGWLLSRVIGTAVASWWLIKDMMPDPVWIPRVLAYETAFLWVFCAWNGLVLTSMFIFNTWMSRLLGQALTVGGGRFGFPVEPAVLILGNAGLIAFWLWRYWIAWRAIRWSNF